MDEKVIVGTVGIAILFLLGGIWSFKQSDTPTLESIVEDNRAREREREVPTTGHMMDYFAQEREKKKKQEPSNHGGKSTKTRTHKSKTRRLK